MPKLKEVQTEGIKTLNFLDRKNRQDYTLYIIWVILEKKDSSRLCQNYV